jgi:hypothetical protein
MCNKLLDHNQDMTERMSRATKNVAEGYTVLLLLAWNDITTDGGNTHCNSLNTL